MIDHSNGASGPPSHVEAELATQPGRWQEVVDDLDHHRNHLPVPGERVAVVGCGTSLFMARAYAQIREAAGHGETDAFPASEFRRRRRYDRVVVLSRSGTTTEVVDVLHALGDTPTTAITSVDDAPVNELATNCIVLRAAAERSVVQTRFATTALMLLRASTGVDVAAAIADGERALQIPLPIDPASLHQATFLGVGWAGSIADEAALKCREAAGFWTESYPAMEYRHGPISVSGPGTAVWAMGAVPEGLHDDVQATGATFVTSGLDPMAELIVTQRMAVQLARHAGLDPDHPRSLNFSVILPSRQS